MKRITFILSLLLLAVSMTAAEEATISPEQNVVDRFWTLLEKSPRRGTAFDRVYAFYIDHRRSGELLSRCRETIEKSPDSAAGWTLLALIRERRGEWDEAIDALKKAAAANPSDYGAPLGLGEILLHRGRIVEAIEALDDSLQRIQTRIRESDTTTVSKDLLRILQTLGRACERYGDRDRADRAWNLLEEHFSDDPDILIQIAETLDEEGKPEESLQRYRRAGELIKNDDAAKYRVRLAVADLRQQLGDRDGAAYDYRRLLDELSPTSWQSDIVRNRIEQLFRKRDDLVGLAEYYRKRLETVPDDFESTRRLATVLRHLSREDEARTVLEKAVERNPSNIPLRLGLADRLAAEQRFREAAAQYETADRLKPNNPDTLSLWAHVVLNDPDLETETRKQRAAKILKRFSEAAPDDPVRVATTAGMLDAAGLDDEAEAFYQRAARLRPDDPGRLESLGHFYHRRNRHTEAAATLRKMVEGGRTESLSRVGGILRSLGYRQEAAAMFRDAVDEKPDDFDLRMKYVDLLLDAEDFETAASELNEAEKRAEPLGEQYRRFLSAQIDFLQRSGRLLSVTEKLRRDAEPSASDAWKLAAFLSALGRQAEAATLIDDALRSAPESVTLAETAANMFDKAGRPDRAAEIFEHLLKIDPPRRIEHLKRLAELQKELGRIDRALETARLVMASGSGNPANIRYYADMLVAAGRFEDGIDALRRAVRVDGSDTASLSMLANLLFEAGRFEDSFEILWRLFEQAEDLPGKLAAVSVLATCYRQSGRFDELPERLRRMPENAVSRRDAVFCLAQAHLTVDDSDEAYRLLQTLLSSPPATPEDGRILYTRLSSLAESRGDLQAAIRYQEMLCGLSANAAETAGESERLLNLYRKSGDEKAATDVVFNRILRIGDLRAQIVAVDDLLAHADYPTASDVVAELLKKNPEHWELLYRRLMAEFWLGNFDAADRTARRILEPDLSRSEPSLEKRRETKTAKPGDTETAVPTLPNQPTWRFVRKPPTWHFSGLQPNPLQRHWALSNVTQFETIFRDRLQLPDGGTVSAPARPQFVPESTADARFGAETWLFRIALQRDLDAPGENPFARTQNALREFRQSHPVDGDSVRLEERLRMEYFVEQARIIAEANRERFTETDYTALFLDGNSVEQGEELRCRLETTLAFRGDEIWTVHAARRIVYELNLDDTARMLGEIDFVQYFRNLSRRIEIRDRFTKEELEEVEKAVEARLPELRNENARLREQRTWTEPEAVDFLVRFWERMLSLAMENRLDSTRQGDLASFLLYVRVLRKRGFSEQADRIEEIRRRIPRLLPSIDGAALEATLADAAPSLLKIVGDRQHLATLFLNGVRPYGSNSIVFVPVKSVHPAKEERDIFGETLRTMKWLENKPDAAELDRMFAEAEIRYDKIVDAVLEEQKKKSIISATEKISTDFEPLIDRMVATSFFYRIPDLLQMIQPIPLDSGESPGNVKAFASGALRQKTITVTREYLDRLDRMDHELRRLLDLYFHLIRKLEDDEPGTFAKNSTKLPSLQDYNSYFERWQGNRTPDTFMDDSPPMIFFVFYTLLETADHFVRTGRPGPGVDPSKLQSDRLPHFVRFLDEKREHGTPIEKLLVGKFQRWLDDVSRTANRTPRSAREYRLELEAEETAAEKRSETLPPDRLLLLAVYNRWDGRPGEAVRYLDAVPFTAVADLRLREQIVLRLFKEQPTDESLKKRAETAVDRLLGYQLKENELLNLYETLSLLGENTQARKVRDRLLHVATNLNTQYKLLDILNREESVGEDPAAIRFAFRVLQGPSVRSALVGRATFAPEARDLALRILEKGDQLYEYAVVVEKLYAASPDSPEVLFSLVDIYLRLDRQDEASELVGRIEGMVASRKITSQDYENLIRRGGLRRRITDLKQRTEIEEAAFRLKSTADRPEKLLENLPARVLLYERTHLVPDFIGVLKKNRAETLVPALVGIMPHVENWLDNFYSRDAARSLLEYAWTMPGVDEETKTRLRLQMLESFSYKTGREECYPMFYETVFGLIDTKKDDASILFRPTHVDADRAWCLASTFLDLAEKLGKLYEVARRLLDRIEGSDSCRAETLVLAAAAESRRQNDGNAFDFVRELRKRDDKETHAVLEKSGLFLARELSNSTCPEVVDFAVELLEQEAGRVRDHRIEAAIRDALERIRHRVK